MKQLASILTLFFSMSLLAQSPWTKKKNETYLQLSFSTIPTYNKIFGDPEYSPEREISDNTLQLYGEYGISEKTTLFATLPLKMVKSGDIVNPTIASVLPITTSDSQTSLGNIQLGVKHNFYNKDWVLSGQLGVEANTSNFDNASGLRTGYDAWTFTPLFLAGKSFGKSYFQSFVGFDVRTNNYSSNFKIGAEYGRKITKSIWLIGYIDVFKSLKNGDIILPDSNLATSLYRNNQEFGGFGLKVIGEFTENFGVTGGFGGAFFAKNLPKQAALTFGLYHKF